MDKPTADAVCAGLESAGVRCWIAPRDTVPSANYAESIVQAIENSRMMVVIRQVHAFQGDGVLPGHAALAGRDHAPAQRHIRREAVRLEPENEQYRIDLEDWGA